MFITVYSTRFLGRSKLAKGYLKNTSAGISVTAKHVWNSSKLHNERISVCFFPTYIDNCLGLSDGGDWWPCTPHKSDPCHQVGGQAWQVSKQRYPEKPNKNIFRHFEKNSRAKTRAETGSSIFSKKTQANHSKVNNESTKTNHFHKKVLNFIEFAQILSQTKLSLLNLAKIWENSSYFGKKSAVF